MDGGPLIRVRHCVCAFLSMKSLWCGSTTLRASDKAATTIQSSRPLMVNGTAYQVVRVKVAHIVKCETATMTLGRLPSIQFYHTFTESWIHPAPQSQTQY